MCGIQPPRTLPTRLAAKFPSFSNRRRDGDKMRHRRTWCCRGTAVSTTELPLIMGIVNVTPDSFSDGGQLNSVENAVQYALLLETEGAHILDIGGESTRPSAEAVSLQEELDRTIPVIERLAQKTEIPISIDTTKAAVAKAAIEAGAAIINDISGLTFDPEMVDVAAATDAGVCVMHIKGTPQTMQDEPVYEDVVAEVCKFLADRIAVLELAGVTRERICVDPGIGFGKTALHNLELLRSIDRLHELGCPVLIGHSRKRFLKHVLGRDVEERLAGTIGVSIALAQRGVDVLRVHDVRAVSDALTAWKTVASPHSS